MTQTMFMNKSGYTTVEKLSLAMSLICMTAAEQVFYSKPDEDNKYWVDSLKDIIEGRGTTFEPQIAEIRFTTDELAKLSVDTLLTFGFRKWKSEETMLLPLWICELLIEGGEVYRIGGDKIEWSKSLDRDHRGGCVAFYIKRDTPIELKHDTVSEIVKTYKEDYLKEKGVVSYTHWIQGLRQYIRNKGYKVVGASDNKIVSAHILDFGLNLQDLNLYVEKGYVGKVPQLIIQQADSIYEQRDDGLYVNLKNRG